MTDREAMSLALDALEDSMYPQKRQFDAIVALKQALAQPEQEPTHYWKFIEIACAKIKAADDEAAEADYMLDSDDCIKVLRGEWNFEKFSEPLANPLANQTPASGSPIDLSTHIADSSIDSVGSSPHSADSSIHTVNLSKPNSCQQCGKLLGEQWVIHTCSSQVAQPEPRNDAAWYWHDLYKAKCEEIEFGFDRTASHMAGEYVDTAQPKQEPVAVWELTEDGWDTIADADWMETLPIGTKLYTAPHSATRLADSAEGFGKRKWQGLTEDEIKKIMQRWRGEFDIRDIERLLKDKNT